MSTTDGHTAGDELIDRILVEARAEAEKLRTDAERSVHERRESLARRLREIGETTDERLAEMREQVSARTDAAIALAEGRARLRDEDRIYRAAEERTREAMRDLRASDGYTTMLAEWIVEAAIGLGSEAAIVSCPAADRDYVSAAFESALGEIEKRGLSVSLVFDAERPETGQGVVLRDAGGRRVFSNLVDDRMRRFAGELQRIVYHTVIEAHDG